MFEIETDIEISGAGTIMLFLFSQVLIEHNMRFTARQFVSDYVRREGVKESITAAWNNVISTKMTFKSMLKMCFQIFGAKSVTFKIVIEDELGISSDSITMESETSLHARTIVGKRNLFLDKLSQRKQSFSLYLTNVAKLEGFSKITLILSMETNEGIKTKPASVTVSL